jgi:hypothetical protein
MTQAAACHSAVRRASRRRCGPDVRSLDAPSGLDEARFAPMMSLGVGLRF